MVDRHLSSIAREGEQLMTTVPAAYAEFGQTLAFTERTMTAVLRDHLAQRDVEPETWYALKLVAGGGPHVARSSLIGDLEGSRGLDADSIRVLLARLTADGLIAGDDAVDLTDEGTALFESLRDHVLGATVDLLDHLDLRDVETTVRTLKAITRRSQEGALTGHAGSGAGPSVSPPSVVISPSKSATVTVSAEWPLRRRDDDTFSAK